MTKELFVVIIHDKFPPDYGGGGEYVVLMQAKYLQQYGCRVRVICSGDPAMESYEGIETTRLPTSYYLFNTKNKKILSLAKGADIIQTYTYHGYYPAYKVAKSLKVPIVATVLAQFGDEWINMKGWLLGRLFRWYEKYLLNLPVDSRVYLSDFSYQFSQKITPGNEQGCIIEPGISLDLYSPADEKSFVLFAGKLEQRKGIGHIIDAARRLPDIPFHIVGWGNFDEWAKKDLPGNIRLIAYTDRVNLAAEMTRARIFIFPTRIETFGLAVAEAMASGCAIISSSMLPFAGTRIDCDDSAILAKEIESLWNQPELCREYGKINHQLAQKYNWKKNIDELQKLYQKLANQYRQKE